MIPQKYSMLVPLSANRASVLGDEEQTACFQFGQVRFAHDDTHAWRVVFGYGICGKRFMFLNMTSEFCIIIIIVWHGKLIKSVWYRTQFYIVRRVQFLTLADNAVL